MKRRGTHDWFEKPHEFPKQDLGEIVTLSESSGSALDALGEMWGFNRHDWETDSSLRRRIKCTFLYLELSDSNSQN